MTCANQILPANLPKCFVSTFSAGEKWRKQFKFAVQLLWAFQQPQIITVSFSLN